MKTSMIMLMALSLVLVTGSPIMSGNTEGIDFTNRIEPVNYEIPDNKLAPGNVVQTKTRGLNIKTINASSYGHRLLLRYDKGDRNILTRSELRNDYGNSNFEYAIPW